MLFSSYQQYIQFLLQYLYILMISPNKEKNIALVFLFSLFLSSRFMSLCIDIYNSSPCCLFQNSNPILLLLLMYMTLFFSLLIAIGYIEWIFEYLSERRPKQSIYRWEWSMCSTLPSILCRPIPMIQCLNLSVSEFDWFFLLLPHSPLLHVSFLKTQILRTGSLTSIFDTSFSSIVIFSVFQYKIEFKVNVLLCFLFLHSKTKIFCK